MRRSRNLFSEIPFADCIICGRPYIIRGSARRWCTRCGAQIKQALEIAGWALFVLATIAGWAYSLWLYGQAFGNQ